MTLGTEDAFAAEARLKPERRPGLIVFLSGLVTTAVALGICTAVVFRTEGEVDLRGLQIVGFALGGVVPLLILRKMSYCSDCQRYRKKAAFACIPA